MTAHSGAQVDDLEQTLIVRAQAGDRFAYEQLLRPAMRPATRLAYAMLRDRSEAEDVFQESALRAWRRMRNLRAGSRFEPWFIGIVANQCREVRRRKWWQTVRLPDIGSGGRAPDEADWLEGEDLRRALARLPFDQRVAVLMHFHLDMPISAVAAALQISQAGVKARINRALKRLRPAMGVTEAQVNG